MFAERSLPSVALTNIDIDSDTNTDTNVDSDSDTKNMPCLLSICSFFINLVEISLTYFELDSKSKIRIFRPDALMLNIQ